METNGQRAGKPFFSMTLATLGAWLAAFSVHAGFDPRTATGEDPTARWTASGGETYLTFDAGVMDPLELSVRGSEIEPAPDQPARHLLEISPGRGLDFWAPGAAFSGFADGELAHRGELVIEYPGGRVSLRNFVLRPLTAEVLELVDESGEAWLVLDYIHPMLYPESEFFTLWNMDVRIGAALAARLGRPEVEGIVIGQAFTNTYLDIPSGADIRGGCATPNWHDGVNYLTDVELSSIGGVQQMAREAGVRVVIAPSATLRNVGTADVPWYPKFHTGVGETYPQPYDRDQHPFLVWALYRQTGEVFEQLAVSEAKHAFFTVNGECSCGGGNILWSADSSPNGLGCTDTYGTSTNDNPSNLGVRDEIPAFTGAWEQCGSMFAPNASPPGPCVQEDSGFTSDEFERRLVVPEADLATEGASYWLESWYVIRDDVNIFNGMARRALSPTLAGSTWTFGSASTVQGAAIDEWVAPGTRGAALAHVREATDSGHYSLAVRVVDLGGGDFRYIYALMNYDFDPQFDRLALEVPRGVKVSNITFSDPDENPANDWVVSQNCRELSWVAPLDTGLDWGRMATFTFEADAAPVDGDVVVRAEETGAELAVSLPAPASMGQVSCDGFEEPNP